MALTRDDIAALMKGIAPALEKIISERSQAFADLVAEQRRDITKLEQRVAQLEGSDPDADAMRAIEQ